MRWHQDDRATFPSDEAAPPTLPELHIVSVICKFISTVRGKTEEARTSGELAKAERTYRIHQITHVHDSGASGRRYFQNRIDWDSNSVLDFRLQKIQPLAEFSECVAGIARDFESPPDPLFCVLRLADEVIYEVLEGRLTPNRERAMIDRFIGDLQHSDCALTGICQIDGVFLEGCDEVKFAGGKIRKVLPQDLSNECLLGEDSIAASFSQHPTAIIEFEMTGKTTQAARQHARTLLKCLRLFRLASVRELSLRVAIQSVVHVGMLEDPMSNAGPKFKLILGPNDQEPLTTIMDLFPSLLDDRPKSKQMEAAHIAVGRYNDAVCLKLQSEPRITLAVTTLEALLLKGGETNELVYRLALRVATLLQRQFEPLDVKERIKKAYGIRSRYVHGNLDPDKKSANEELCAAVLDYARVCVQICLQLHSSLGKDSLIALLDDSFLSKDVRKSLEDVLFKCLVTR